LLASKAQESVALGGLTTLSQRPQERQGLAAEGPRKTPKPRRASGLGKSALRGQVERLHAMAKWWRRE